MVTTPFLGGLVRMERVRASGYYDTVSVIGTDAAAVEFVEFLAEAAENPSSNAPWYITGGNSISLDQCSAVGGAAALNVSECTVTLREFTCGALLYLTPTNNVFSLIRTANVRCTGPWHGVLYGAVEHQEMPVSGVKTLGAVDGNMVVGNTVESRGAVTALCQEDVGAGISDALLSVGAAKRVLLCVYAEDAQNEPGVVYPPEDRALIATHLGPAGDSLRANAMSHPQIGRASCRERV